MSTSYHSSTDRLNVLVKNDDDDEATMLVSRKATFSTVMIYTKAGNATKQWRPRGKRYNRDQEKLLLYSLVLDHRIESCQW